MHVWEQQKVPIAINAYVNCLYAHQPSQGYWELDSERMSAKLREATYLADSLSNFTREKERGEER